MKLDDHVGFMVTKTLRQLNVLFNQEFNAYGITSEQWSLLKRLDAQEGISMKDLAQAAEKDQGNVTRILDLLEKRAYVRRSANPNDKRSTLVYLTPAGKELTERLIPLDIRVHEAAVEGLTEEELAVFARVLDTIAHNASRNAIS
ncbi:MarR family transcriptional regulator [Paenibacillus rhizovicinus]|uniref:MarR family transcriptional regulator n=1 Tax=Paenibacillus rhizovicinus TaxID=2704463 RepID=A0A6C0P4M3_9BACL|nr:MarR family transcriptional regulator [Paenibacillus rhizovicinus]QHW33478.1 MarR family transcriptional regulator [Paenibacillus rhizovicinus]